MASFDYTKLPIYEQPKKTNGTELKPKAYLDPDKEKEIADAFKSTDKDGDLKLNKQEIADRIIAEYQKTGKLPEGYSNIGDYIADQMKKFENFDTNKDGKLNIDEYTNMSIADEFSLNNINLDDIKKRIDDFKKSGAGEPMFAQNPVKTERPLIDIWTDEDKARLDKALADRPFGMLDILTDYDKARLDKALADRPFGMLDILTDYDIKKGAGKSMLQ